VARRAWPGPENDESRLAAARMGLYRQIGRRT
jgi:hypothetical protein